MQKVLKLWKDASPQIQDRKLAGNAAIWDIHGIQKKQKKHSNKNEANTNRSLAAILNSLRIQKEGDINKTSFDAIGNIHWSTKKEETR